MSPQEPSFAHSGRFFSEALPLLATYVSGESVSLAPSIVGLGAEHSDEWDQFAEQLRLRHALSAAQALIAIIPGLEAGASTVTHLKRETTEDALIGRLDIPRYVHSRASNFSWPRTYPVIVTEESAQTPENQLLVRLLRILIARLRVSAVPLGTAEWLAAKRLRDRLQFLGSRLPWATVHPHASLKRLHLEAGRRLARRQTGNERAYLALLKFVEQWQFLDTVAAPQDASHPLVTSMMSFPDYSGFADRVFEVWCLREIGACFLELGAIQIEPTAPLTRSRLQPTYRFRIAENEVEIWFQRALEGGAKTWNYVPEGVALRGAPDITMIWNGGRRLIFDAKNRVVTTQTRSEETYKLLGYFQNFPHLLTDGWGVLAFVATQTFRRTLAVDSSKIELLAAHPEASQCSLRAELKEVLRTWIVFCLGSAS